MRVDSFLHVGSHKHVANTLSILGSIRTAFVYTVKRQGWIDVSPLSDHYSLTILQMV